MATSDHSKKYQVFIPDLLKGQYADLSWFPPDNKEKQEKLGAFFGGPGSPPDNVPKVAPLVQELNRLSGGKIKKWSIVGFCWGGKIITLTLHSSDLFSAAASCHPAMVAPDDASSIKIPFIMLPSKDEDANDVKGFQSKLTVPNQVETFPDQIHVGLPSASKSIAFLILSLVTGMDGCTRRPERFQG